MEDEILFTHDLNSDEHIYHYTSGAGLYGLINNKKWWVTDCGFLNDPTEFTYGLTAFNEIIKNYVHCTEKRERMNVHTK